jgi:two-component system, LuxR family, sensor kinase FixL
MNVVSSDALHREGLLGGILKQPENASARWNAAAFCVFLGAFYLAYRFGMSFGHKTSSPFWFVNSVLLCALLLFRPGWWWLLLLATFPIRLLTEPRPAVPSWFLVSTFTIDCAQALLAAVLLRRLLGDPIRFETVRDYAVYCLVAVLLAPLVGAVFGGLARQGLGYDYWLTWEQWFFGDAMASLIVTPVIFYWVLNSSSPRALLKGRWLEVIPLGLGLLVTTALAFEPPAGALAGFTDARFYAPIPFLFWAAIRFGMFGATGGVAFLTVFAAAGALSGKGPFIERSSAETAADLQQFLLLRAVPLYVVAVFIEQMQHVQRSLRESERRFRVIADTAPVLIWMSGRDKLCEFFNKGWLDFTGRTVAQELGHGWTEGVHPEDFERCMRIYSSSFEARETFEMDYRLRRADGQYRWILDKGVPRYAAGGSFLGYVGCAVDVTERREHEASLRESEERYRGVVENQTDFVCRFRADTALTFVNEAYCRFLGRQRSSLRGTQLLELLPEQMRDVVRERLAWSAATGEPGVWECEVQLPDGRKRWQHWICRPIFDANDRLDEFQAIGHDITDRKDADDANRKLTHSARLAALGELTAIVAHEISQPLSAILSNAEAAEIVVRSEPPRLAEIREILSDICSDVLRADESIRRIRGLMQKREIQLQPMDLNQTVDDVLRLTAGDALRRRVQIRTELASDLPQVSADRLHLQQVLLNLIVNGMDSMNEAPEPERQLTVRTKRDGAAGAIVTVRDRGQGIPANKMSLLFDSFFTTKADGMGLGLSIARSIIEAHHGRIWAQNDGTGGAEFHFTVQAAAVLDSGSLRKAEPPVQKTTDAT